LIFHVRSSCLGDLGEFVEDGRVGDAHRIRCSGVKRPLIGFNRPRPTLSFAEVNVVVGGLPIWEAGHEFLSWEPRLRAATSHSPRVVTFGLVVPELALLSTSEGVRRVAERWGLEHLANLAVRYRQARGVPGTPAIADLAASLNQQVYFPEVDPATGGPLPVEMPPEHEIAVLFEEFAHGDGKGIVEWFGFLSFAGTVPLAPSQQVGGGTLGGYLGLLRGAAGAKERFQPSGLGDLVRRVYETLDVPRGLRAVYDLSAGGERHVPTYRDLAERAAIELEHLHAFAPRLSRCRLCCRVFVVRGKRPEAHCRQYVWLASPPRRFLERCVPPASDERERTRKRLHQRYRRALAKHGGDGRHPEVRNALGDYSEFVTSEPVSPRGRRPAPSPGFVAKVDQ
jgi:hypothetical protein